LTGDLEKDTDKTVNSVDSENNKENTDKSPESGSSPISGIISNFKKFNMVEDLKSEKLSDKNKKSETKTHDNPKSSPKQKSSKNSNKEETSQEHVDDNTFHIPGLSEHNFINLINNKRDRIIKVVALLIGGLLILYGLVIISASVTKVADNVIFGEEATLAVFLMLLGVLIIVAAFAQRILDKTFLSEINTELEVTEERSKSDANSKKGKDENANKVDNDNKDNIVGENKR
jgi:ABC-type bacteriocin/lantibiotic exporter with double-glycine peptidase domain